MIFTALSSLWATRKGWITAVLIVVLLAVIAGGWLYLHSQARRIVDLTSERDVALQNLEHTRAANLTLQKGIAHAKQTVTRLNRQMADARQQAEASRRIFSGHNLENLATQRSGLITRRARDATERVLSDLESAINGNHANDQSLPGSSDDRPGDAAAPSAYSPGHRQQALVCVRCSRLPQSSRESPGLLASHPTTARCYRILPRMPPTIVQG